MQFDIVIPVGPNDENFIEKTLIFNKKNIIGYRNIYIIGNKNILNKKNELKKCIIIDESQFPFNKESIQNFIGITDRSGWYLQQLLKLYAGNIIDGILENYLVVDADTIFLKPTTFFENKIPLYNVGTEYNLPYFIHMINLHPSLTKQTNKSGICHHMIFQKYILDNLFKLVETFHNDKFYNIFINSIEEKDINGSGASEYEIYFNYLIINYPSEYKIRQLNWRNLNAIPQTTEFDYVSVHWYQRMFN